MPYATTLGEPEIHNVEEPLAARLSRNFLKRHPGTYTGVPSPDGEGCASTATAAAVRASQGSLQGAPGCTCLPDSSATHGGDTDVAGLAQRHLLKPTIGILGQKKKSIYIPEIIL